MCLAACDKAPMLQCNFRYMEALDMAKVKAFVEEKRAELERAAANGAAAGEAHDDSASERPPQHPAAAPRN